MRFSGPGWIGAVCARPRVTVDLNKGTSSGDRITPCSKGAKILSRLGHAAALVIIGI